MIPTAYFWKYLTDKNVGKVKKKSEKINSLTPHTINKY